MVAINLAIDSGGLFQKAGDAANSWNTSVAEEGSTLNDLIGQIDNYMPLNWDAILADATANPNKYKHPDQSSTNGDIGIGTDGKPVNMDLWNYIVIDANEIELCSCYNSVCQPGYDNANIIDGKIQGMVPQYIKKDGQTEFYPVTKMDYTFRGCAKLVIAPVIPKTVRNMENTFDGCLNLTKAPSIPSSVTYMISTFAECANLTTPPASIPSGVINMYRIFYNCSKLTGKIEINANAQVEYECFEGAATAEGTNLIVTGSSPKLDEIIATKSNNSNITKGT